jgi:hypothetical protein
MFGIDGSSGYMGSTDSTSSAPSLSRSTLVISVLTMSLVDRSFAACLTMYSRTMPTRMPVSGFLDFMRVSADAAYDAYGCGEINPLGSAVYMSRGSK